MFVGLVVFLVVILANWATGIELPSIQTAPNHSPA